MQSKFSISPYCMDEVDVIPYVSCIIKELKRLKDVRKALWENGFFTNTVIELLMNFNYTTICSFHIL